MGMHQVLLPKSISYGSSGGPSYNTAVIETHGGAEQRIARWSLPRHKYDAAYGIKSVQDLALLKAFFIARRGAEFGFRYFDWFDFSSASDGVSAPTFLDQVIGEGDGSTTTFQLRKGYTSGGTTVYRKITLPATGSFLDDEYDYEVVVAIDGVEQTTGWTVSSSTGIITFDVAPADSAVITAGFIFHVAVRFETSVDKWFSASYESFESGTVPSVTMIELVDESPINEDFPYRGADAYAIAANVELDSARGIAHSIEALDAGLSVRVPDPAGLPLGGPHFLVYNIGATNSFDLLNSDLTTITSIGIGESVEIWLLVDGGGNRFWLTR